MSTFTLRPIMFTLTKSDIKINTITKNGNAFVDVYADGYDTASCRNVLIKRINFNLIMNDNPIDGAIVRTTLPDKRGGDGAEMLIFKTLQF